jgi:WD40 repeat protein
LVKAALAVILFLAAVLGLLTAFWFYVGTQTLKQNLAGARNEAERARQDQREARLAEADADTSAAVLAADHGDADQALLFLASAIRLAHAEGDAERESANRIRFYNLQQQMLLPSRAIAGLPAESQLRDYSIYPSGRWVVLLDQESIHLWDWKRETELPLPAAQTPGEISAVAWSSDGSWLALGTPKQGVLLCRFPGTEPPVRVDFSGPVKALCFSNDGKLLAIGGDKVRVWNCQEERFLNGDFHSLRDALTLAFSPKSDRLLVSCADGKAQVFALANGKCEQLRQFDCAVELGAHVRPLFADDGRSVICLAPNRRQAVVWNVDAGQIKSRFPKAEAGRPVDCQALSPNGRLLAIGGDLGFAMFDLNTGEPTHSRSSWLDHSGVQALAFSPDSRLLLSSSRAGTLQLWNMNGQPCAPRLHVTQPAVGIQFLSDGGKFAAVQINGAVSMWNLPASSERHEWQAPTGSPAQVIAHADDQHFLVCGTPDYVRPLPTARVFDSATGKAVGKPMQARGHVLHGALSPTQPLAALAVTPIANGREHEKDDRLLEIWNWQTGERLYEPIPSPMPAEPRHMAFHPEGRTLAVLTAAGDVQLFDPQSGKRTHSWSYPQRVVALRERASSSGGLSFSPEGQSLLTWGIDNTLRVWDARSGQLRFALQQGEGVYLGVAFSPDLRRLATCHSRHNVSLWNFATGEQDLDAKLPPFSDPCLSVEFVAAGKQLLIVGQSGQTKLWDWRAGRQVGPPFVGKSAALFAGLLSEPPLLLTAGAEGRPRIWDSRTGFPLTFPGPSNERCWNCVLLRHGHTFVAAYHDGSIRAYELAEMLRSSSLAIAAGPDNDR